MKYLAIISQDKRFIRNASGTLATLGYDFEVIQNQDHAKKAIFEKEYTCVLFDENLDLGNVNGMLAQAAKDPENIICTDGDEKDTIRLLADYGQIMHVFGKNKPYYEVELTTALNKITTGKVGGIETYLNPGTPLTKYTISDYQKKNEYLDAVTQFSADLNCFADFPDIVATVTWELLMNAIFDAPYDFKTNKPKYAHLPRTQPLILSNDESVELAFGADENSFVVSVSDKFGMLTRDQVVSSLVRCSREEQDQIRKGNAGAGVGIYLLFNSISQINFNINPKKKTEVIFVVFLSKRRKDFVLRARSVNFFIGEV